MKFFDCLFCVKRHLIVSFVCFQLKYGCRGIQYSTFKEIHCSKDLVVGHWPQHQIIGMLPGLSTIGHKIKPCFISTCKMTNVPVCIVQKIFIKLIHRNHCSFRTFSLFFDICPTNRLFLIARCIKAFSKVGIRTARH